MPSIIIHIQNEDPVLGEVEKIPSANDNLITVQNPRRRDGKDLPYLDQSVTTVIWPVARVNFIELVSSDEEEEIISFVRE
jgi:hypothetical protein